MAASKELAVATRLHIHIQHLLLLLFGMHGLDDACAPLRSGYRATTYDEIDERRDHRLDRGIQRNRFENSRSVHPSPGIKKTSC